MALARPSSPKRLGGTGVNTFSHSQKTTEDGKGKEQGRLIV